MRLNAIFRRIFTITTPLLILFVVTAISVGQSDDRVLQPDTPVQGILDSDNVAQIYLFTAGAGQSASLSLNTQEGFQATMVLSDGNGSVLRSASTSRESGNLAGITNLELSQAGVYYVTVFPRTNVDTVAEGSFSLTLALSGEAASVETVEDIVTPVATEETSPTPIDEVDTVEAATTPPVSFVPPQTISVADFQIGQAIVPDGIQVDLTWNTDDDLNLQIRDPGGNTLFWDSRTTIDGGSFGADVNGLCEIISTPPNVETASWSGGSLPTGSYEILVYYRQACGTPAPVDFTVDITVNGVALSPVVGTIDPPQNDVANVFLSNFVLSADATATTGDSGPYTNTRVLPISTAEVLEVTATPVSYDVPVQGVITNEQYFQTYQFSGNAGDTVNIQMTAQQGNLDTLLLVLNAAGNIIADNDDIAVAVNTNSQITSFILPTTGDYTVFASRYGKDVGGTEGVYSLEVGTQGIAQQTLDISLPRGDIEVTLTWNTNADLQLLVRDPFGNAVYDDERRIQSGGELIETGNINCTASELPVYYIYWPPGFLRIGSYEIEVWYQSECDAPGPVQFNLFIVVNGQQVFSENATIQFNERYLTSFSVSQDGQTQGSLGGIIGGSETLPFQQDLASAISINPGDIFTGSITPENKYDIYVFDGRINDVLNIRMNANSQTLDTQLYLIDPNFQEIASNDDATGETTDSIINNIVLTQDGQYYILATHFGAIYGGTTGGYTLSLSVDR